MITPSSSRPAPTRPGRPVAVLAAVALFATALTVGTPAVAGSFDGGSTADVIARNARALAGRGDRQGCERALLEADKWFAQRAPHDDPVWLRYFDQAELAAEFAHSYRDLGMHDRAVEHAQVAVDEADPMYVRSISFCRTVLAAGHLGRGEIEQGLALADQVVSTTVALRSGRCVAYVHDFMRRLDPYAKHRPVTEFIERTKAALPPTPGTAR
jgi:hypothetical protein